MKYLAFHCPLLFQAALDVYRLEGRMALHDKREARPNGLAVATLCAASLEAFTNDFVMAFKSLRQILTSDELDLLKKIDDISNDVKKDKVQNKFLCFHEAMSKNNPLKKGDHLYQKFKDLINIRNAVMHAKTFVIELEKVSVDGVEGEIILDYPEFIEEFKRRNIIRSNGSSNWLNWLDDEVFCSWCLKVTEDFANATLNVFPSSEASVLFKNGVKFFDGDKNEVVK